MPYELEVTVEEESCEIDCELEEKIDLGNTTVKPLTVTENGEYIGGEEQGKRVAYSPVNVNVQPKIEPLNITENGTYTASEIDGYNPVTVDVKADKSQVLKQLVDMKGTGNYLFATQASWRYPNTMTDEFIAECLRYDTTENAVSLQYMFYGCDKVTTIPPFSTKSLVDATTPVIFMFSGCSLLKELPMLDLSKITNMNSFSSNGFSLTVVPLYDTTNVKILQQAFGGCTSLEVIPALDLRSCTNNNSFVNGCAKLKEIWIRNIKANITVGSGTTYGHLLTIESLIHLIKELRDTGAVKTLTVGSENRKKLANVYVRLVDITDEMRAEDDLIDEKLPFELCESTDEGAMWIEDYVFFKNWEIA